MSEPTYLDQVLEGEALLSDIDDFVERWHQGDAAEALHEYLGMTWDEYRLWTERPESRRLIVAARQRGKPLDSLLAEADTYAFAARGLSEGDARAVREWLEKTGRLPRR
jgi:hypothetical protein